MIVHVLHNVHRVREARKDVKMHYGRPQELNNEKAEIALVHRLLEWVDVDIARLVGMNEIGGQ